MKILKQFAVILAVCLIGETLRLVVPLPIPASVWGMVLMLVALMTGLIKLPQVENAADFLVQTMPVMFVPTTTGLMVQYESLRVILIPFLVINIVALVVTFGVTGKVTEFLLKRGKKEDKQ